jgi:hypothetical protein
VLNLAAAAVHTTGINWESVTLLIATIVASFVGAVTYISTRMDRNREMTKTVIIAQAQQIIDSVTDKHLAEYRHHRRKGR